MNLVPAMTTCSALPLTVRSLGRLLAIGAAGLVIWEICARLIAPLWIGFALDPTGLIEMAVGLSGGVAQALHLLTGLVIFPIGMLCVARPIATWLLPGLPWPLFGLGYGVALWVFAMYVMASLLGGAPAFLGFAPVAWASLLGHLGLGLGMAGADACLPRGRP